MQVIAHQSPANYRAMPPIRTDPADRPAQGAQCSSCRFKGICLPGGLDPGDLALVDSLGFSQRRLDAGEPLYHEGEDAGFIYAVRMGTLKSSILLRDGRQQVTGFQVAGDVVGLDALATGHHASSVHTGMPRQALQRDREIEKALVARVARVQALHFRNLLDRFLYRER